MNDPLLLEGISITYDSGSRIQYQSLAEFLQLIGVFVTGHMFCNKDDWTKESEPDLLNYTITDASSQESISDLLKEFKTFLIQQGTSTESIGEWYDILSDLYQNNNLFQSCTTLRFYRAKSEDTKDAGRCFEDAADHITRLMKDHPFLKDNPNMKYARLYCKQKANLAYFICEEPVAYYVDDLAKEALALVNISPYFSSAWFLLGLIYEISKDYTIDAIDAFHHTIKLIGNRSYASEAYYWLGRRYEQRDSLKNKSLSAYEKAYTLHPTYRNMYKLAKCYLAEGKLEDALRLFAECLRELEQRTPYLDPLECEYLFNVKMHLCYLYLQRKDYSHVIGNAKDALNFRQKLDDANAAYVQFYKELYGEERYRTYISMTLHTMDQKKIFRYLTLAYQVCGMREMAEQCRGKYHSD